MSDKAGRIARINEALGTSKPMEEIPLEDSSPKSPKGCRFGSTRSGRSVAPDHWGVEPLSASMITAESARQSMEIEFQRQEEFQRQSSEFQMQSHMPEHPSLLVRATALLHDVSSLRIMAAVSWICSFILVCVLCLVCTVPRSGNEHYDVENSASTPAPVLVSTTTSSPSIPDSISASTTLSVNVKFALPEKKHSLFVVNISASPAWSRRARAKLLSAKGMSAVLYSYNEADVGIGIQRVLKIPRSSGLAADMELEARMTITLPRIGVNSPECVVCVVEFDDQDGGHCTTQALVKEFLYGYDISDIIAAVAAEDEEDPDLKAILLTMAGKKADSWYKKDDRKSKLIDRIQEALRCLGGQLAQHVLSGSPYGLFLDLSNRNFMWATRKVQDVGVPSAYKLWLVDALMFPPESSEYKRIENASAADVWYRYYVGPWFMSGPGGEGNDYWSPIELPESLADAQTWARDYCSR